MVVHLLVFIFLLCRINHQEFATTAESTMCQLEVIQLMAQRKRDWLDVQQLITC